MPTFKSPEYVRNVLNVYTKPQVQEFLSDLKDEIGAIATGTDPAGNWDASSGSFPANAKLGTYYIVSTAGTVDGETFRVGDWLIPVQDDADTTTYADFWVRGDYSQVVDRVYDDAISFAAAMEASRGTGGRWLVGAYQYTELAGDANDGDYALINAAGVKLKPLPLMGMYSPDQWGVLKTGVDQVTLLQRCIDFVWSIGGGTVCFSAGTYHVSSPLLKRAGVKLLGAGPVQFDNDSAVTIQATADFAGVAVVLIDNTDFEARSISIEGMRIQGTWVYKSIPDDHNYTGSGEHGIMLLQTGTIVLRDVAVRYCDGSPLMADGAWQTWIYGGYYKQCGKPFTVTGAASGRGPSQFWLYGTNIQKNRVAALSIEDADEGLGVSQFDMTGSIVEFGFSRTDDSVVEDYDPNWKGLVLLGQAKTFRARGTHFANAAAVDEGDPIFLMGVDSNDAVGRLDNFSLDGCYVQPNDGVCYKFAKPSNAAHAKVGNVRVTGVAHNINGTRKIVDFGNDIYPEGTVLLSQNSVSRGGDGERFAPVNFRDVGEGADVGLSRSKVRIENPEGQFLIKSEGQLRPL